MFDSKHQAAVSHLRNAHIIKLQQAAREAGLKWKSGDLTKAGIIERLEQNQGMLFAADAVLTWIEAQSGVALGRPVTETVSSFMDEIDEAAKETPSAVAVSAVKSPEFDSRLSSCESGILALTQNQVKLAQIISEKTGKLERETETRFNAVSQKFAGQTTLIEGLISEIEELRKRAPIVFNIEGVAHNPVSGQHAMFPRMVKWLSMRKIDPVTRKGPRTHILLVGPASSGKTTAALEYAKLKGLELYAQPLSMDSFSVVGYTAPDGKRVETEFTRAWINGGVFLWDELSMSSPEAIGTLNAALANGFCSIPGIGTVYAHPDFYFIAGDNSDTGASLKYGARSLLDGASLDRFIRLEWDIDPEIEKQVSGKHASWLACVRAIRAEISARDIAHVGATMRATIAGSMALDAGIFTHLEILEDTCKKGALVEVWSNIKNLPAVRKFLQGE